MTTDDSSFITGKNSARKTELSYLSASLDFMVSGGKDSLEVIKKHIAAHPENAGAAAYVEKISDNIAPADFKPGSGR